MSWRVLHDTAHAGVWQRLFQALADMPDFGHVLIDSTIAKVYVDATGPKGGLQPPRSAGRAAA